LFSLDSEATDKEHDCLGVIGPMNARRSHHRVTQLFKFLFVSLLLTASVELCGAEAFHSGGVGSCNGCHSIHNTSTGTQRLLRGSDPSSLCLNCHSGLGGPNSKSVFSPDGSALTPGGDFYWLTKNFSWIDGSSPGYDHGHNIIAVDFGLLADPILTTAPGGTYPAVNLSCISCHNPHGRVAGGTAQGGLPVSKPGSYAGGGAVGTISGNYRLLGDAEYSVDGYPFNQKAPIARQSQVNKYQESDLSHVDYGSGMSEWCGNCHATYLTNRHTSLTSTFTHPAGDNALFNQPVVDQYNSYLHTGDLTGTFATAYLQFVPFERGVTNIQLLDPNSTQGANANANLMCLSCHRAHASAFPNGGRWDFTATLLAASHPATGDTGATANDVYYSYYGRNIATEFGAGQRQLCEKCHTTLP